MRLHFLRHGIAEDHRPGLADSHRRLTADGIEQLKESAAGFRALDLKISAILTSPLVRARETAALAAEALGLEDLIVETPRLASGCHFGDLAELLRPQPDTARVLLVGHEPDFSSMIETLIGGGMVRMRKGALACVDVRDVRPGGGELQWLLNPSHLRRLR